MNPIGLNLSAEQEVFHLLVTHWPQMLIVGCFLVYISFTLKIFEQGVRYGKLI